MCSLIRVHVASEPRDGPSSGLPSYQEPNPPNLKAPIRSAGFDIENKFADLGDANPLDQEEGASIHMYTQDTEFYQILNANLRHRERLKLKPFFPYLDLLVTGLHKLLVKQGVKTRTLYRGVRLDLKNQFKEGKLLFWWSVTSTTGNAVRNVCTMFFRKKSGCGLATPPTFPSPHPANP